MNDKPKEFIYIDNIEVNSILAQLDNGLPQLIHDLHQVISGSETQNSKTKSHKETAEAKAILGAAYQHESRSKEAQTSSDSTMDQRAIDTIYSDYAVNIIQKRLESEQLLNSSLNIPDGSYTKIQSSFRLNDFERMATTLSLSNPIFKSMADADENEDDDDDNSIEKAAQSFNLMFPDTSLISLFGAAVFAENKNFRMSPAQRLMLPKRNSKITVLGIVEGSLSSSDINIDEDYDEESESNISDFGSQIPMSGLGHFNLIKENDRLIKPIAIYFE